MFEEQLAGRDITDPCVLEAMEKVPRHEFVPKKLQTRAYRDQPLPIGYEQTISQPYMVAYMTQLVEPKPDGRALDVGTGSGYQAAVLASLVSEVYSIEIIEPLATAAAERLHRLGYENVHVRCGNGYEGWPEKGPYDCIIVAAAADHVTEPIIIPVGQHRQILLLVEKLPDGTIRQQQTVPVAFVPMTGDAG
mgnify:CR=1 FL=1